MLLIPDNSRPRTTRQSHRCHGLSPATLRSQT